MAGEVPGAVALVLHHRAPADVGGVREVEVAVEVRAGDAEPRDLEGKKQTNCIILRKESMFLTENTRFLKKDQ